jgi:hypothetical protein
MTSHSEKLPANWKYGIPMRNLFEALRLFDYRN